MYYHLKVLCKTQNFIFGLICNEKLFCGDFYKFSEFGGLKTQFLEYLLAIKLSLSSFSHFLVLSPSLIYPFFVLHRTHFERTFRPPRRESE